MTVPVIDVDFAVPSATVEVGMPSVDVAIPGLTGPAGLGLLHGPGVPGDDFPLLLPLDGTNDPWRWSPRGVAWFGPAFEVTWDDGDLLNTAEPTITWDPGQMAVRLAIVTGTDLADFVLDFAGVEADAAIVDFGVDIPMVGSGSGIAFLYQYSGSLSPPYDVLVPTADIADFIGDAVLGAPYAWPDADTLPTPTGVDGQFYIQDGVGLLYGPKANGLWGSPFSLTGPPGDAHREVVFGQKGPVTGTAIGTVPYPLPYDGRVTRVLAACGAQTSGTTRFDVNIDFATIYPTQSQRPSLSGVGQQSADGGLIEAGDFTAGQFLTVDRDSAGVGLQDIVVVVEYEPT